VRWWWVGGGPGVLRQWLQWAFSKHSNITRPGNRHCGFDKCCCVWEGGEATNIGGRGNTKGTLSHATRPK
jgi:hypothetical protein